MSEGYKGRQHPKSMMEVVWVIGKLQGFKRWSCPPKSSQLASSFPFCDRNQGSCRGSVLGGACARRQGCEASWHPGLERLRARVSRAFTSGSAARSAGRCSWSSLAHHSAMCPDNTEVNQLETHTVRFGKQAAMVWKEVSRPSFEMI